MFIAVKCSQIVCLPQFIVNVDTFSEPSVGLERPNCFENYIMLILINLNIDER